MIKFGPSGNSERFYDEGHVHTIEAPAWLEAQLLTAYEYSFGRGINIGDKTASEIGEEAKKHNVEISVHAPYYINFANPDDAMADKSYMYVINSCRKARLFGGKRVVFHPAAVGKTTREEAFKLTERRMARLTELIYEYGMDDCIFCPETMGKINQIGDTAEVAKLCRNADFFIPTIDFGHINARTMGGLKNEDDYERLIVLLLEELGEERVKRLHIHFSKIEYGKGGEVRHLTFADDKFGPEFLPLAKILKKYNLEPVVISESSGKQTDDALEMKRIYESL